MDARATRDYGAHPVITAYRTTDTKQQVESVLVDHDYGMFRSSAVFHEEMLTDDRYAGVLSTRISALLAAPVEVKPGVDKRLGRKAAEELGITGERLWQSIASAPSIRGVMSWGLGIGVGVAQIHWDTTGDSWVPRLEVWHPQWLRWDWLRRVFVAQTTDGEVDLPRVDRKPRSDGKWLVWCPWGVECGWRQAFIRQLGEKYLMRQWDYRDWARYCERHGMPILVGEVPDSADQASKEDYYQGLTTMGSEGVLIAPQREGGSDAKNFGLKLVEATARTWDSFQAFKREVDSDIAIAILGQNLTTEVAEGSRAAAQVHNLVRLDKAREDATIANALRAQVLSHWAEHNYGDAELAPVVSYKVDPPEDRAAKATAIATIGQGVVNLAMTGEKVDTRRLLEDFGIPLVEETEAEESTEAVAPTGGVELTTTAIGAIVRVNEARKQIGLGPLLTDSGTPDPDGLLTVAEYTAKHAPVVAAAVTAEDGGGTAPTTAQPSASEAMRTADAILALAARQVSVAAPGPRPIRQQQDALISSAVKLGARSLAVDLAAIKDEVDKAEDFEDLKRRIALRFRRMDPSKLAAIVKKATLLANLAGRYSTIAEV